MEMGENPCEEPGKESFTNEELLGLLLEGSQGEAGGKGGVSVPWAKA